MNRLASRGVAENWSHPSSAIAVGTCHPPPYLCPKHGRGPSNPSAGGHHSASDL